MSSTGPQSCLWIRITIHRWVSIYTSQIRSLGEGPKHVDLFCFALLFFFLILQGILIWSQVNNHGSKLTAHNWRLKFTSIANKLLETFWKQKNTASTVIEGACIIEDSDCWCVFTVMHRSMKNISKSATGMWVGWGWRQDRTSSWA